MNYLHMGSPFFSRDKIMAMYNKDGFGSNTDEIGSECHFLPHFNLDTNANADLIGYEYKTDSSNPDSNSDTFSI